MTQFISNSKLFLFGIVLIIGVIIISIDFETDQVVSQEHEENFSMVIDDWFKLPSLLSGNNGVSQTVSKSYQYTEIFASASTYNSNICKGNCYDERQKIESYTSSSCSNMIQKWHQYPDWILRPLLAHKILEVCDI